jgi:lysozyme
MINMKISDQGIELIQRFEGCRLGAYKDAVGVPTIGYGHTHGVKMGDHITHQEAEQLLVEDVSIFEKCVNEMFGVTELTQGQFDALVSFAFNLGCGALRKSTLRKRIESGNPVLAAREFPKWCHAGHRKLKGLVRRRAAERELFLS